MSPSGLYTSVLYDLLLWEKLLQKIATGQAYVLLCDSCKAAIFCKGLSHKKDARVHAGKAKVY